MIYTCKTFTGFYPVGTAAVVVASDAVTASNLLNSHLQANGLPGDSTPDDMEHLDPEEDESFVRILCDGNY